MDRVCRMKANRGPVRPMPDEGRAILQGGTGKAFSGMRLRRERTTISVARPSRYPDSRRQTA